MTRHITSRPSGCQLSNAEKDIGDNIGSRILVSPFKPSAFSPACFCSHLSHVHKPPLPSFHITERPLVEEAENFSSDMLSSGFLVIHYPR
jgi:hypothetical protein